MDFYEDSSRSCKHFNFPAHLQKKIIQIFITLCRIFTKIQTSFKTRDTFTNEMQFKYIQLHKNTFLHCGLGWPEWTYTRIWGVDKKATFSHKSSKFDTRIWKEEFISSIAVESILIMFKNVEKTKLCPKVWAIKAT